MTFWGIADLKPRSTESIRLSMALQEIRIQDMR